MLRALRVFICNWLTGKLWGSSLNPDNSGHIIRVLRSSAGLTMVLAEGKVGKKKKKRQKSHHYHSYPKEWLRLELKQG